jgi:hypothetical protein
MPITAENNGNKIIEVFDDSYDKQVNHIAMNLRPEDFDELFYFFNINPYEVVIESWKMSLRRWIVLNKNNIAVAVLGVRPLSTFSKLAIPWLLGTKGLEKMKKFFMKHSKPIIEEMKMDFEFLYNFVDSRYIKAVKWLKWCGFTIEEAVPFGIYNVPFHRFYMRCKR